MCLYSRVCYRVVVVVVSSPSDMLHATKLPHGPLFPRMAAADLCDAGGKHDLEIRWRGESKPAPSAESGKLWALLHHHQLVLMSQHQLSIQ